MFFIPQKENTGDSIRGPEKKRRISSRGPPVETPSPEGGGKSSRLLSLGVRLGFVIRTEVRRGLPARSKSLSDQRLRGALQLVSSGQKDKKGGPSASGGVESISPPSEKHPLR